MKTKSNQSLVKLTVQHQGRGYDLWKDHAGKPLAKDLDAAAWLEFDRARNIRKLIERHASSLGDLCSTVEQRGGRPAKVYYLTREQVLYLAAKSETPRATEVLQTMIAVFAAVLDGGGIEMLKQILAAEQQARALADGRAKEAEERALRFEAIAQRQDRMLTVYEGRLAAAERPVLIGKNRARLLSARFAVLLDMALGITDKEGRKTKGYRELRGKWMQEAWKATKEDGALTKWHRLTFMQEAAVRQWLGDKEDEINKALRSLNRRARKSAKQRYADGVAKIDATDKAKARQGNLFN